MSFNLLLAEDSLDVARVDDTKQRLPGATVETTATATSQQHRTTGEPCIAIASNSSESSHAATRRCLVRQVLPRQSGRLGAGVGPDRHGHIYVTLINKPIFVYRPTQKQKSIMSMIMKIITHIIMQCA